MESRRLTKVIHIKDTPADWEGNSHFVYIGRAGKGHEGSFGNPIKINPGDSKGSTLFNFRDYFYERLRNDPEFKRRVEELRGKTLVCFCKPDPCHGDVIADYLNNRAKCIVCKKEIKSAAIGVDVWETPSGAVAFDGGNNFGSSLYDSWIDKVQVEVLICDDCLQENRELLQHYKLEKQPTKKIIVDHQGKPLEENENSK